MRPISDSWQTTGLRWLKFNAGGGIGIAVQLLVLVGLKRGFTSTI